MSPTSPRSFVLTFWSALSEKFAIFCWEPAPYWSTMFGSVMSIFAAKSATIFFSSGVSVTPRSFSASCAAGTSGSAGFSTGLSANGVRVSSGIMLLLSIFMLSPCVLRSVDSLNIVLPSGHHGAGSLFAASDSPSFSSIVSRTVISDDMSIA